MLFSPLSTRLLRATLATALFVFALAGCGPGAEDDEQAVAPQAGRAVQGPAANTSLELAGPAESASAPEMNVETLDGETIALTEDGHVTLVNFWATWCGPCRIEIPDLIALENDLGADGLRVVGVAVGEDAETVRPFAEQSAINYALVPDADRAISEAFGGVMGLPTTVVIGPDGTVRGRILGLFPTDALRSQLEALLEERAS